MSGPQCSADSAVPLQARVQQAIMAHPFFDGSAVLAFGLAGAALKVIPAQPQAMSTREAALEAAARDFIEKVDRGHARSLKSYSAFLAALSLPRPQRVPQ